MRDYLFTYARDRANLSVYSKRTMDNDEEQTEQDKTDTYLRTAMEEKQEPSTWEEYDEEEPFEENDEDESSKENDDEGKWMTQFSYPTKEEENTLFIAFMTGNVEDQRTWINAKMNLARASTNNETRRREEEILNRIIPTGMKDLDKDFDEEEMDNSSECRTHDPEDNFSPMNHGIYSLSFSEEEKSDKFIDEHQEEEDIQPLKPLMTSYQDHRGQDKGTPHPLSSELDDQLIGAKYFAELDVHWGDNNEHIKDEDKWEMTKTNQQIFEPTVITSSLYYSPTTSQAETNELFPDQKEKNEQQNIVNRDYDIQTKEPDTEHTQCVQRRSRDNNLFAEQEGCTPWVARTEYEGLLYSENQLQTNPMKLYGIDIWPTPTTTEEGLGNFTQNDEGLMNPQSKQNKEEQDDRDIIVLPERLFSNLLDQEFDDKRTFEHDDEQFDPIKTLSVHEPLHNQFSKVAAATSVNDVMTVKVIDMDLQKQKAMVLHRDITINDVIDTLLGKKPDLWKDESKNQRIWIPRPPKNTTLTNHSTLQQSKTIQILNGKQARQSLFLSGQPDRYLAERTDNQDKILLPGETIIKTVVRNIFDAPIRGILLPWNLQTSYIAAFNVGIHPGPLLINLLQPLTSGMVVEDHEPTEGVILGFLETYTNRTTTVLCSLNKLYGLPDKSTSNQRLQFVSHKSERSFELTTNPTHYPEKNGIPERTNPKICKLFFPILEYNKKPCT